MIWRVCRHQGGLVCGLDGLPSLCRSVQTPVAVSLIEPSPTVRVAIVQTAGLPVRSDS